ncbi:hypothetical protein L210DRAFT_140141 [Boletus edulis BED1]|uniref:Uncharacterized protein n=1 Tax=Boletus edulis BED1 TaxID=1328754 RepID=A0AAD4BA72_BOLED|nr:hypothetical protein L210DRAFT_140141 [Boletus edulis BED1]
MKLWSPAALVKKSVTSAGPSGATMVVTTRLSLVRSSSSFTPSTLFIPHLSSSLSSLSLSSLSLLSLSPLSLSSLFPSLSVSVMADPNLEGCPESDSITLNRPPIVMAQAC